MYANMMDTIGFVSQFDPEVGQAMNEELGRQRRNLELIASENLVSPAVMAAMVLPSPTSMQKVCPTSVLRRLRICRRSRGDRYRTCLQAVRCQVCQCTAPFRCTGKHCCILRTAPAGRYGYGHESGTRRSSDTRFSGQHLRQVLQLRSL